VSIAVAISLFVLRTITIIFQGYKYGAWMHLISTHLLSSSQKVRAFLCPLFANVPTSDTPRLRFGHCRTIKCLSLAYFLLTYFLSCRELSAIWQLL
jgi:hypothetical protein